MKCDALRASRIYDSLVGRLGAPEALRDRFMAALTRENAEEFFFMSAKFGTELCFMNSRGLWVVGWRPNDMMEGRLEFMKAVDLFEAVRGANDMLHSYMWSHLLSGCPVEAG